MKKEDERGRVEGTSTGLAYKLVRGEGEDR
jgi:hypothetical protein